MRLPVYVIRYGCRKCGTGYTGEWDPNRAGHVEPATVCPSCGPPVRLYLALDGRVRRQERSLTSLAPKNTRPAFNPTESAAPRSLCWSSSWWRS